MFYVWLKLRDGFEENAPKDSIPGSSLHPFTHEDCAAPGGFAPFANGGGIGGIANRSGFTGQRRHDSAAIQRIANAPI
jgi:hypothetical protein